MENLQRRDLDYIEEAEGLQKLMQQYHLSQEQAARRIGKSQSAVANKLRILRHPPSVLQALRENHLTERHARALLKLPDEAERLRVIKAPDVHEDILNFIPDHVRAVLASVIDNENKPDTWDIDALNKAIEQKLLPADSNFVTRDKVENWDYDYLVQKLTDETIRVYEDKIERYKEQGINYHELEKIVLIKNVDTKWIDHIDSMDQLRKGISLRSYGQVDPVVEYKKEGLETYEDMTDSIREDTVGVLLKAEIEKVPVMKREEKREYVTNDTEQVKRPAKAGKSVGRNDPCPCGSGKKYKKCCGKDE